MSENTIPYKLSGVLKEAGAEVEFTLEDPTDYLLSEILVALEVVSHQLGEINGKLAHLNE